MTEAVSCYEAHGKFWLSHPCDKKQRRRKDGAPDFVEGLGAGFYFVAFAGGQEQVGFEAVLAGVEVVVAAT